MLIKRGNVMYRVYSNVNWIKFLILDHFKIKKIVENNSTLTLKLHCGIFALWVLFTASYRSAPFYHELPLFNESGAERERKQF